MSTDPLRLAKNDFGQELTASEVPESFMRMLQAALKNPMFAVPKEFETWIIDKFAMAGVQVAASQIVGSSTVAVRATATANQSLTSGSFTAITFDGADDFDTGSLHDPASNNTRLTFPSGGLWAVAGAVQFASHATGYRLLAIRLNGATRVRQVTLGANAAALHEMEVSLLRRFVAGDYVELMAEQSSGGPLNSVFTTDRCPLFWAYRVAT